MLVATNIFLSRQNFCRDKKHFVATKIILSLQAYFCRDKRVIVFVATKLILVAAPANDSLPTHGLAFPIRREKKTWRGKQLVSGS